MTLKRVFSLTVLSLYSCLSVAEFERQFPLPAGNNDLVGNNSIVTTSASDTLIDIAARYHLGYNLIRSANPDVDVWLPGEGTPVVLPFKTILPATPRRGIVINVAEMRLYFYTPHKEGKPGDVAIYPISVGRSKWATPTTHTHITGRAKNPIWYPSSSIRAEHAARGETLPMQVPSGPDNPLGEYLLMLDIPGYFIHGTNRPLGIGMQVTHGCIRMYPKDIEQLVKDTPNGTEVTIINQTFKTGWLGDQLYLEVHQPLEGDENTFVRNPTIFIKALVKATRDKPDTIIDWNKLDRVISEARGIPQQVGHLPQ